MLRLLLCFPVLASASNTFGNNFLEENKIKNGVVTLPSGLQYKVLRAGSGSDHPTIDSPCSCHYEGRTAENYPSGHKFDSSYDRGEPATFAPKQVIKGWTIAMQLMVEGDKWEMYIPSDLAYGDRGRPPMIPGGAVLVFTMEIIKIKGKKIPAKRNRPVIDTAKTNQDEVSSLRFVFNIANLVGNPSEASFMLEVHPEWAPLGAKRLQELVAASFFDGVRFFRVIDNFMAQFGIHGDPTVMKQWRNKNIKDDAKRPGIGNTRGRISFAMAGPNTRSTQFFINLKDNKFLDNMGFTPVAEVVEGMDVVDRIFKTGEGAPNGPGPSQGDIQERGNAYLNERFPQLTYVKSCRPVAVTKSTESSKSEGSQGFAKSQEPQVQDFGDGLKLLVTQAGDGKTFPHPGDLLTMHYTLTLAGDTSSRVIDSSRTRNQPFTFTIGRGQVIKGWDRGVMRMSLGERGVLSVPSALGYGARGAGGAIPPNADLTFDVQVLAIDGQRSALGITAVVVFVLVVTAVCLFVAWRVAGGTDTPVDKGVQPTLELGIGKPAE